MSQIDPTSLRPSDGSPLNVREGGAQAALRRLAAGVRNVGAGSDGAPGAGSGAGADSVSLSSAAEKVGALLVELKALSTKAAQDGDWKAVEAIKSEIDGILGGVTSAASAGPIGSGDEPPPFDVIDLAEGVERVRLFGAEAPKDGGPLDVNLNITQSAQVGAIRLSFGGGQLDLAGDKEDPGARFVIEIRGAAGAQQLSFASGTTLADLAATINVFTEGTGVVASVSGTGLRLESTTYGSGSFASVQVLEDGDAVGDGAIAYSETNNFVAADSNPTSFALLRNAYSDFGQDVAAEVNGVAVVGSGLLLRPGNSNPSAIIGLSANRAQTLGEFLAFRVQASGA